MERNENGNENNGNQNNENGNNENEGRNLNALADAMLKSNGYSIWGQRKGDETWKQYDFERSMYTGAFSRNSERGRRS